MAGSQANGQFNSSTLLSSCKIYTANELNNQANLSLTTVRAPFVSGNKKGLLGNYTSATATGSDPNAYMTFAQLNNPAQRSAWLEGRYTFLLTVADAQGNKLIPVHPSLNQLESSPYSAPNDLEPISTYNTKVVEFLDLLGREFCYYQNNYFNTLNYYLMNYSAASTQSSGGVNLNDWQSEALVLNQKVNTMISLINYMASKNIANIRTIQNQLVSQTTAITTSTESLRAQADILRDNNKTNTLYKQMVEFTEEKNRANKNLLAVYFTLNVVAITCLFIAARTL